MSARPSSGSAADGITAVGAGRPSGKMPSGDENELACAMFDGYWRLCGPAFGDACFERALREGVGEEQVIDDLLDAPFVRVRGGA